MSKKIFLSRINKMVSHSCSLNYNISNQILCVRTCMCVSAHSYVHACMHAYMHVHVRVCAYMHAHTCTSVCMHWGGCMHLAGYMHLAGCMHVKFNKLYFTQ